MKLKHTIYKLVAKGDHGSRINSSFDYIIMTLIGLNVLAITLETIPEINERFKDFFRFFEAFSVIVFTIEYLLRIYVSALTHSSDNRFKSAFKFMFSIYGIIDLLAILPFYLPLFLTIDLRFIRMLRLMRLIRILKLSRYNNSLNLIWNVIKEKKTELSITGFVTLIILIVASFLMYHIEGHVQPDKFPDIITSFWWAIATLTTVGYGDVYPITGIGKFVSGLIAVLGIGLVALPTGLVSAGFMEKIGKSREDSKKCPHCGKHID